MAKRDERLLAYLRGELNGEDKAELSAELSADPSLVDALLEVKQREVEALRAQRVDDPSSSMRATVSETDASVEGPSLASITDSRLELGEVLGKGGMGVVHLGHQTHLGRTVAVKTAHAESGSGHRALLSEAFVTGQLEHPNIVPIHDIVLDEAQEPQVILKRIEGSSWKDLLRDEAEVRRRFDVSDTLGWHLRVLLSVCQALRFAHSRGFVHRDVKPSNVMLGRFGEIYLLDWGLAFRVPTDEDPAHSLAFGGTPAYMAPEQFGGAEESIGPRTDVYLVGATLYEILHGRPPRKGGDLVHHLAEALGGPPALGDDVPEELAEIVKRAMAPDPEERFSSVQEVRRAIDEFLEHRASRQLAAKAAKSAEDMAAAEADGDEAGLERAFSEATFGYHAALDAWPDNQDAKEALANLIRGRIEAALESGAAETAERLLALGPDVDDALRERVQAAVAEHARRKRELAQLQADQDRTAGVATRRVLVLVVFGSWVAWWIHAGIAYPMPTETMTGGAAAMALIAIVGAVLARRRMTSRQNQNLVMASLTLMGATVSWLVAAQQLEIDPRLAPLPIPLIWAATTTIGAFAIDRRALPSAAACLVGFHIAASDPEQIRWVLGAASAFWLVNALIVNVLITREARASA